MSTLGRHCRRLRTALLALLVLGMVVSPTLAALGELHGVEHAVAAASDDAHGHTHSSPQSGDGFRSRSTATDSG